MTVRFRLNGTAVALEAHPARRLIDVLREDFRLTGTKEGCGEGECGACTVLIDGQPAAACLLLAGQVEGREVTTIEAFIAGDPHEVARHLVEAGGVQCGFCTPGIVLSAHALLEREPAPSRERIAEALGGHLCRCTGYAGIVAGIEAAARAGTETAVRPSFGAAVGAAVPRRDGLDRALGRIRYVDDLSEPGMLHGAAAYAWVAHGRVKAVHVDEARAVPGVVLVATAADIPGRNEVGAVRDDQPLLAWERVRFPGDRVALVAARTREAAREAARLVRVDVEALPAVHDPDLALRPDAPRVHELGNECARYVLRHGDATGALEASDVVVEEIFRTSRQEHAYLEPQGVLAVPDADGGVTVRGSIQCPYHAREKVAQVLGVEPERARIAPTPLGGGFGGKQDYPNEVAACAALLARLCGKPVKLVYERDEDMAVTSKRHPYRIRTRLGARRDGTLLGAKVDAVADAGAYAAMSPIVLWRSFNVMAGPYRVAGIDIEARAVFTNNVPASAFRGFGHPQALFAHEAILDRMAARLGRDPMELRFQNLLRPGDANATGQVFTTDLHLAEVLESVRRRSSWAEARAKAEAANARGGRWRRGLGVALLQFGCNLGVVDQELDHAEAVLRARSDGVVEVRTGLTDMGQGALTVLAQIAADALDLPLERIRMLPPHTGEVGDCGPSAASRVTMVGGMAILDGARRLRERLGLPGAAARGAMHDLERWERAVAEASPEGEPFDGAQGEPVEVRGRMRNVYGSWEPAVGQGDAYVAYTHAADVAQVEVDTATGRVRVEKVWAAYDIGTVVNPVLARAQVEGGVVQGVGYALLEELQLREGRVVNANLSNYLVPTALDVPEVDVEFVEGYSPPGPFGAKSLGEPSFVPAAAAIAAAVRHATGLPVTELPATAERVFLGLRARREAPPAVVVAAGEGRRMGGPKALLRLGGEALCVRVARSFLEGGCPEVVVVLGAGGDEAERLLGGIGRITTVRISDPSAPMFASVRAGLAAAEGAGERGAFVHPVDAPRVASSTVWGMIEGLVRGGREADAVVAGFGGRRGHPVWISGRRVGEVLEAPEGYPGGLRGWMGDRGWGMEIAETGDPAVLDDFDRREDAGGGGS
ncbi:MAG: molybdopterin-dependent oxidoreductase [Deltaproteobacteria bacterium]|nr:molybdopterin-dependent oxidoreductase [Deltaproteobacteria bacterium]